MSELTSVYNTMKTIDVKQVILQGPPGTSKTHGAKEIICNTINTINTQCTNGYNIDIEKLVDFKLKEENYEPNSKLTSCVYWDMVQFHPSYSYEDFVRGITVSTNNTNVVLYNTVNKIFGKMCELASREKNQKKTFFLIIDEINRADVATVFGELIYALEYRGNAIATPYKIDGNGGDRYLTVPNNLYIIGTMNTADKSVGTIDMAIRRRFLFVDQLPDRSVIEEHLKKSSVKDNTLKCFDFLEAFVEETIRGNYKAKDFKIGHTYFLPETNGKESEVIRFKIMYQVLPMLREYVEDKILVVKDDSDTLDNITKKIRSNSSMQINYDHNNYKSLCMYLSGSDEELKNAVNFLFQVEES